MWSLASFSSPVISQNPTLGLQSETTCSCGWVWLQLKSLERFEELASLEHQDGFQSGVSRVSLPAKTNAAQLSMTLAGPSWSCNNGQLRSDDRGGFLRTSAQQLLQVCLQSSAIALFTRAATDSHVAKRSFELVTRSAASLFTAVEGHVGLLLTDRPRVQAHLFATAGLCFRYGRERGGPRWRSPLDSCTSSRRSDLHSRRTSKLSANQN